MARDNIDKVASSIYTLMKGAELTKGLEQKRSADRIGVFQELLIKALKKSTMCCFNGRPYYYNGCIYVALGKDWDAFNSLVLRIADKCRLQPGDKIRLEGVKKTCRGEVSLKVIEPDNSIIVLRNGVLDLRTNTFHKFNKKFKQVTQMNFDYDPEAVPNVWTDYFLDSVLDEAAQRVLQEFMGAIFIDRRDVKIEKMLILYGAGRNGKSVIQSTLIGLLGEDNVKTLSISDLVSGSERKQNMASINGKRLNYCSELQPREFENVAPVKALISGEPFEVRLVFVNNFTAHNIPLMMANTNRIPYMKDPSHGFGARFIILPFERVIEEQNQNKQLAKELQKEYSGILNWMLAGRQRLIANNYEFSVPQRLKDLVSECQAESSTVLQFMKAKDYNRSILDMGYEIRWLKAQPLFFAYHKWCAENDVRPETEKRFYITLKEVGFSHKRDQNNSLYGVYQRNPRPIKEEYKKRNENNLVDGMDNLAHWLGVSRQTIEKAMRLKYLTEGRCYRKEGRRHWFDLTESRAAIKKFMKAMSKRHEPTDGVSMELKAERRFFNKVMTDNGLPFRKYETPVAGSTVIYVNDDFNYQLDKDDWKRFVKFPSDVKFDLSAAPEIVEE